MKYFKLIQDTPECKAGAMFYQSTNGDALVSVDNEAYVIKIDKINDFAKFFAKVDTKLARYFKPAVGAKYYYLTAEGEVRDAENRGEITDAARISLGNSFEKYPDALAYKSALIARAELTAHPANQYQPNWKNAYKEIKAKEGSYEATKLVENTVAYAIAQDKRTGELLVVPMSGAVNYNPIAYYATEDDAKKALSQQSKNYKTYMEAQ